MKNLSFLALIAALVLLVTTRAAYIVDQAEQVILVQFGEPW